MIIVKYISVPVFQLHFSETLSPSVLLSGFLIPYSVYILVTVIWAKQKLIVPAVAPDAFSCVVCREFFSIAVAYDAPSNF